MSSPARVLIYLLRRDLRLADNPVFNEIARLNKQSQKPFTHLLPVYCFPAQQVEVSGFLSSDEQRSPYPDARSYVGGFWRCGHLRAKFLAESAWDLKKDLESVGSGLEIRVGMVHDAVKAILDTYRDRDDVEVHGLWMTEEEGWEEKQEEEKVRHVLEQEDKEFRLWTDEKYLIDDRDLPFDDPRDLPDVFTSFRKNVEPLRAAPRKEQPRPESLPPLPEYLPPQQAPFSIPDTQEGVIAALHKPLAADLEMPKMPEYPPGAESAHPFLGGSRAGLQRVQHLLESGAMTRYKDTRNGLLGKDFSTKLSAWLALGCISARQVHWRMMEFEDAKTSLGKDAEGYGQGETKGTAGVRFELLWRDYMRLCTKKFGTRLFYIDGFERDKDAKHKFISSPFCKSSERKNKKGANDDDTRVTIERFIAGRTGTGLVDASQRELFLTGYTSNRARQNVASYLAKHLGIDWRIGAEWYETNLIDYDVSSNWGNWLYNAGVGNDPRGEARVFNPVKQAFDYDPQGAYVQTWVPELRGVGDHGQNKEKGASDRPPQGNIAREDLQGVFQAWQLPDDEKKRLGLEGVDFVERPLVRIQFSVNRRGGGAKRGGGGGGGGGGRGRGRSGGRGRGDRGRGKGREARTGQMEKAGWMS